MGQKVNPHGIRVGIIKDWDSRWYADKKNYGENLVEDYKLRAFLKKKLFLAGVAKIEIEKFANKIRLSIHAAKPGIVIGKGGSEIDKLKKDVENLTGKSVILNVICITLSSLIKIALSSVIRQTGSSMETCFKACIVPSSKG